MPRCFALTKKGENKPTKLQTIDDEMREAFGAPPDPAQWFRDWYNIIGLGLAVGKSFAQMRKLFEDDAELVECLTYLEERYESDCWRE